MKCHCGTMLWWFSLPCVLPLVCSVGGLRFWNFSLVRGERKLALIRGEAYVVGDLFSRGLISSRYYFYNLVQEVIYFDPKILGSFLVLVSVSVIDCCQNFVTLTIHSVSYFNNYCLSFLWFYVLHCSVSR